MGRSRIGLVVRFLKYDSMGCGRYRDDEEAGGKGTIGSPNQWEDRFRSYTSVCSNFARAS